MSGFVDDNNVEAETIPFRVMWSLVFLIIWSLAETIVFLIFAIQIISSVFSTGPNESLRDLGKQIGVYMAQIVSYLTFSSNEKPFPFSNWPSD
jgi:uncharacterized membrane protein